MRKFVPEKLEAGRDPGFSSPEWGLNGAFLVPGPCATLLRILSTDASEPESQGWEHVSVSTANRCPNWPEMCFVKDLFWAEDELVIQYHVPKSEHIDNHPYVLHLWRDTRNPHPRMPPGNLVGIKGLSYEESRRLGQRLWR